MANLPIKNKRQKQKVSKARAIFCIFSLGVIILLSGVFFILGKKPMPRLSYDTVGGKVRVDSKLRVDFNWPVARSAEFEIRPKVYGQIEYGKKIFDNRLSRSITFTPELTWLPGTTYTITLSGIRSALPSFRGKSKFVFSFTTEQAPKIISVTPDSNGEVGPDIEWKVNLDKSNKGLTLFSFKINPEANLEISLGGDRKSYTLKPKSGLSQGQAYEISAFQQEVKRYFSSSKIAFQSKPELIWKKSWRVVKAPGIKSFLPQGRLVGLTEPLEIEFTKNINFKSFQDSISFQPEVKGKWQANDYQKLKFVHEKLRPNTEYKVVLKSGMKSYDSSYLENDIEYVFTTEGPVKITSTYPGGGSQGISVNSPIEISFNQQVDHQSAESSFSLHPDSAGSFFWDGNKMTFRPVNQLSFNQEYQVKLKAGIKGVGNFSLENDYNFSFSTELSVTKLSVPFHRQEHNLSCEVAALVMALNYKGINIGEQPLIDYIGFDSTKKSGNVWGNPNIAFVGDIDGHQPFTGYGVYWQPVAAAAKQYRPAQPFYGWNLSQLTGEIKKGNPVVVWGTAGSGTRIDWKTPQGGNVVAINGEHARVVVGFIGSSDNPLKIITMDPLVGEKYFTKDSFLWNWGLLGNSGVVVE